MSEEPLSSGSDGVKCWSERVESCGNQSCRSDVSSQSIPSRRGASALAG